jgi:hypothetical protein
MGTPTTLSRGSVKDACSMRYASGQKARRILGYEARIGIEEGLRISCLVGFLALVSLKQTLISGVGLCSPIARARAAPLKEKAVKACINLGWEREDEGKALSRSRALARSSGVVAKSDVIVRSSLCC